MTNDLLDSAMSHLRASAANARDWEDDGGLVAHTASRLLSHLKKDDDRIAGDLLRFVRTTLGVPVDRMVKDIEKPAAHEIESVMELLALQELRVTRLQRRLAHLCDILGLDGTDLAILTAFSYYHRSKVLHLLLANSTYHYRYVSLEPPIIAEISGVGLGEVQERLAKHGPLVGMGLVTWNSGDRDCQQGGLLRDVASLNGTQRHDVEAFIVPDDEGISLDWEDFAHLSPLRDLAEQILRSGKPVSILLHGEPGTGKSEFARALARRVGRGATFAGLVGKAEGEEPKRDQRLGHLAMLRRICADRDDRIVVVDEADDVLSLARERQASKQFVNRLVEDPKVPTIWIVNDPDNLDKASVRRMTLTIAFERPPLSVRSRIALRAAEVEGLALQPEEAQRLARLPASAAVIATGVRVASLSGGGVAEAESAMASVLEAMDQWHRPEHDTGTAYDPAFSAADMDLADLAERLIAAPTRGWSLLLSGPSGTGKSVFARHLAGHLGIEVEAKRASDLISPFVGETEANIARAFATAGRRGAMLLIDEADSFLYRRDNSSHSWEVSQVNEMLCRMERLESPFVATTNLADRFDPATQRRFTMRVAFRPMTASQARVLFAARFCMAWPAAEPLPIDQTPGDFAVVASRADLLGEKNPCQLVRWLRAEAEARGDGARTPLGF